MGWTGCRASHYDGHGIDRKAECDGYFLEGANKGYFKVLKSAMRGSVYYAAIKNIIKIEKGPDDVAVESPDEEGFVWAAVFLTSVREKEDFNFFYKDMDETCGPRNYDCPKSILDLLSDTDNEYALKWRIQCQQEAVYKKTLRNVPIGGQITFLSTFNLTNGVHKGDRIILTKKNLNSRNKNKQLWIDELGYSWKSRFIPREFEQIEDGQIPHREGGELVG